MTLSAYFCNIFSIHISSKRSSGTFFKAQLLFLYSFHIFFLPLCSSLGTKFKLKPFCSTTTIAKFRLFFKRADAKCQNIWKSLSFFLLGFIDKEIRHLFQQHLLLQIFGTLNNFHLPSTLIKF